ncbi:MAG: hypothetical protein FWE23_00500 [Chitinivibrionia bacterium]|nr:hypothetical protein [Chitinivibrionia bacterium]
MTLQRTVDITRDRHVRLDLPVPQGVPVGKAKIKIVFVSYPNQQSIAKTRTPIKKNKTFKQRLIDFYGADYDPAKIREEIKEVDWGKPVGEEVW